MTPARLDHFRQLLIATAAEIRTQLAGGQAADSSIVVDNAIGRLTRMEAIQAQAIGSAGRRRLEARLVRIERALKRIEDGSYGVCLSCGGDLPEGRLEIMPESGRCVRCASRS